MNVTRKSFTKHYDTTNFAISQTNGKAKLSRVNYIPSSE